MSVLFDPRNDLNCSGCSIVLFLVATLSVVFRKIQQRRLLRKPFPELPMPPNPHWLVGHIKNLTGGDFQKSHKEVFEKESNEFGQIGLWYGPQKGIAVTAWQDAKIVLHAEYSRTRPLPLRKHLDMFLGNRNIGNMNGREWKLHRSWILKALSPRLVAQQRVVVEQISEDLVESITRKHLQNPDDEWIADVEDLSKMITMDVFSVVGLGVDFQCCVNLAASEAASAFETLCSELAIRIGRPFSIPNYFYNYPCEPNRRHHQARTCIRLLLKKIIEDRRRDNGDRPNNDLLGALLDAYENLQREVDGDPCKEEELEEMLSDMLMALLFAGFDTTAITLTYANYLISLHPEVERNCLEEIESTSECDFAYFNGVIKETLRMYPPAPTVPRTLLKPVQLTGGFQVPKGTHVLIPIWLIQNSEKSFPKPHQFRPDRWVRRSHDENGLHLWVQREESDLTSSDIPPGNHNAFFAFSAGGRSCPGQKFAMQEAVVALRCLLKELQFTAVPDYELKPRRQGFVQRPLGGMPMNIRRRTRV